MPRRIRYAEPTYLHVLNRAVRRDTLFVKPDDYRAFVGTLAESVIRIPIPLLTYCVMPNHFHLVIGPVQPIVLSRFMHRLTMVHSKRWHAHHKTTGTGPLYQGRFKVFPIEGERHFLTVCRYVEMNPVRAGLARVPEEWGWSSCSRDRKNCDLVPLAEWPILKPSAWD